MLRIENLHVAYGNIQAVRGVSLTVRPGELVSLIGANGAGKSTILKAIMGLQPIQSGKVLFGEMELARLGSPAIARLGVALVPEGRQLFPNMTVLENLALAHWAAGRRQPFEQGLREVFELFPRLAERKNQLAGTLSGGEQQMVAIARALINDPSLLMLDEPSLGLAPLLVERVAEVLQMLNRTGRTILLVEQNAMIALGISQRAYVLETGRVVMEGPSADLLRDERVRHAYLGIE